jgi:Methyltransferase domain
MLSLDGLVPPARKGRAARAVSFLRPYLLGVAGSAYLFSAGWLRSKNRAAIVELCHHFGYRHESRELPELPIVQLAELVPAGGLMDVRAIDAVDGNVTERELITICRLVRAAQPRKLFEFGTFDGRTTLNMAVNSPPGATIYTLDLPKDELAIAEGPIHPHELRYTDKSRSGARYLGTSAESSIIQLYGDSGGFDFSPFRRAIDFIFVDASHTFAYVVNDSLQALEMLSPAGGTILWHDYGRWDGVTGALNQLRKKHTSFAGLAAIEGTTLAILRTKGSAAS